MIRVGTLRPEMLLAVAPAIAVARVLIIVASLAVWFWTQRLLARRNPTSEAPTPSATISDGLHKLTAIFNQRLLDNPRHADALLTASSLMIDLLGFYLLASAILGVTFEPFLGLFMVFALRQTCQAFCPLPPPTGMIWRNPGCPSILVTYGTACDLFFSGHTAIAVYGCLTLASVLGTIGIILGCLIAAFEIITVLILRAHYTMDIFTGVLAALYVHRVAIDLAPHVDQLIVHLTSATH